ncbi:MAG TPA: HEAT repeat domain-containing protein [Verrucomicrobiae bacterium]|nr:HEAT repeat domain-containing protein [Verrucomicrobiae bacterium]
MQSNASLQEKDAACARLKFIGTALSVPALAALLTDNQLSHSARYALESMQFEEAGQALRDALPKTTGPIRIGIINSLGVRAEGWAVPVLAGQLADPDPAVGCAAAAALGRIGNPEALWALENLANNSSGALHGAAVDALLHCADRLLALGQNSRALRIFSRVYDHELSDTIRVAAYGGMIRSSGSRGLKLMIWGIKGRRGPEQAAALQLVREIQVGSATLSLANLLPRLDTSVQIALIDGLSQRGDPDAAPAIAALTGSAAPDVHPAIIEALDVLGSASQVMLLSEFAASGTPEEQKAARQALLDLRRGPVKDALIGQLATANPGVQAELARALGGRGDRTAIPQLTYLAVKGPDSVRKSALRALGELVDEEQTPMLVAFALNATNAIARQEAAEAINAAYQHIASQHGQVNAHALLQGVQFGSKEARIALMPVCSGLASPNVRLALRTAMQDPEPQVRAAATRALCDTVDPELLDDLVTVATTTREQNFRTLAIGGAVRLTEDQRGAISVGRRVVVLKTLMAAAGQPEQKRLVLAGLAQVPDSDALSTVEPLVDDPAVQNEASRAAIQIALALPSSDAQASEAVLNKAMASCKDDSTHQALEAAIKQIENNADFITDWLVAGPYRQAGKGFDALFDIVFPPETEDPKGVNWQPIPAGTDPKRPYILDFQKVLGKQEQCVGYARTWVHCEQQESAQLQLGSDDGIKVWVNDKQVYAHNVGRVLQPGSDQVAVALHPGWNMLLLKVTHNNQMWQFCGRLRKPDGSHLEGAETESAPKTVSSGAAK